MDSEELKVTSGIPQGSVLNSTLFNSVLNETLETIPASAYGCVLADDITIWSTDRDPHKATQNVQESLNNINAWTKN